jgi:hypothetical protein
VLLNKSRLTKSEARRSEDGAMDAGFLGATQTVPAAVGAILGGGALLSVSWVWFKKQVFGFGGLALSAAGALILGAALWLSRGPGALESGELARKIQVNDEKIERLTKTIDDYSDKLTGVQNELLLTKKALRDLSASGSVPRRTGGAASIVTEDDKASPGRNDGRDYAKLIEKARYSLIMGDIKSAMQTLKVLRSQISSAPSRLDAHSQTGISAPNSRKALAGINEINSILARYVTEGYYTNRFDSMDYNIAQRLLDEVAQNVPQLAPIEHSSPADPSVGRE